MIAGEWKKRRGSGEGRGGCREINREWTELHDSRTVTERVNCEELMEVRRSQSRASRGWVYEAEGFFSRI